MIIRNTEFLNAHTYNMYKKNSTPKPLSLLNNKMYQKKFISLNKQHILPNVNPTYLIIII